MRKFVYNIFFLLCYIHHVLYSPILRHKFIANVDKFISTLNYLVEHIAYADIVKIRLFSHILALRVEEEVIWLRESLRKDRQSKK